MNNEYALTIDEEALKQRTSDFSAMFKVVMGKCNPCWTLSEIIVNVLSNQEDRHYDRDSELIALVADKAPIHSGLPGFNASVAVCLDSLVAKDVLAKSKAVIMDHPYGQRHSYLLSAAFIKFVVMSKTFHNQDPHFVLPK